MPQSLQPGYVRGVHKRNFGFQVVAIVGDPTTLAALKAKAMAKDARR